MVFAVRAFIANLFLLPLAPFYRYYFRKDISRNSEVCIGDCRFWGPESFTSTCRLAMEELRAEDAELFGALTSSGIITFWLQPPGVRRRIYSVVNRFYAIDSGYAAWEPRGITAFVVSIYFMERFTPTLFGIPVEIPSSEIAYRRAAIEWLSSRSYPEELIEPLQVTLSRLTTR
jgi:hypothetical protein